MGKNNNPIGIFDSGLSSLAIAKAIKLQLPLEEIIYFGDTGYAPYDHISKEAIINNSIGIVEFLLEKQCKIIVITCSSAAANAYNEIAELVGNKAILINVIDPVVEFIAASGYKSVGIIGTNSTINSNVFDDKIRAKNKGIMISSVTTPLLLPMINEGHIFDEISNVIIRNYLSQHNLNDIEALILSNIQYPIIKNQINKYYNFEVDIIDPVKIMLDELFKMLVQFDILNDSDQEKRHRFYVSDITQQLQVAAKLYFEEEILLEKTNFRK